MLPSSSELCLPLLYTLVYCSSYSSTLKMEATCSSRTSVHFQRTTWRYIPEDIIFHNRRYNLKSYISCVGHEMVFCALSLAGPQAKIIGESIGTVSTCVLLSCSCDILMSPASVTDVCHGQPDIPNKRTFEL
jgi:hypothetical protein